ncbi:serine hydrolase [Catellatospora sichuanensis]|uniref:serine hydrolase n=1 Tax=Catellatospora sichuanensis TaxID=1969805 RepID=UPI001182DB0A|nr:serine hydrolase [Catellatospora sichuanensis]
MLRLDDTVERWLPGMVADGGAVTVRQLLMHTSGLYNYTDAWATNGLLDVDVLLSRRNLRVRPEETVALDGQRARSRPGPPAGRLGRLGRTRRLLRLRHLLVPLPGRVPAAHDFDYHRHGPVAEHRAGAAVLRVRLLRPRLTAPLPAAPRCRPALASAWNCSWQGYSDDSRVVDRQNREP